MNLIREMLSYPFLVRALAGGMMVSLCASLLGVSLVLRRYSMIGDGLSHVSFGALSIALAMGWSPLRISIPVVVLAAFFLLRITENSRIKSDAAIALISASALALGIIVTSLTTGMTTDVSSYMFGSILAMSREDVWLSVVLSLVVLGLFVICYNRIFAVTFDENLPSNRGQCGPLQYHHSRSHGSNYCTGNEDDGGYAHLQPRDISLPFLHAGIQKLRRRHGVFRYPVPGLLFRGHGGILPVFHTGRGQRGGGEPVRLPAVYGVAVTGPPERLMPPAGCFTGRLFHRPVISCFSVDSPGLKC